MLELHTRQADAKKEKEQPRGDKAEVPPWDGQQGNYWGASTSFRSTNKPTSADCQLDWHSTNFMSGHPVLLL